MTRRLQAIEEGIYLSNSKRTVESQSRHSLEQCPPQYQDLWSQESDASSLISQSTEVAGVRDCQEDGPQQFPSNGQPQEQAKNNESVIHVTSQTVIEYEEFSMTTNKPTFAEDLKQSRVYQRNETGPRNSVFSISSSVAGTGHWSMLSDLSMAEVSNISVINLPIIYQDVHDLFRTEIPSDEYLYPPNGSKTGNNDDSHAISPFKCSACKLSYEKSPSFNEKSIYRIGNVR